MDAPTRIWVDDERSIGGTVHIFDDLSPEAQRYANEYILATEHERIVAEKDAEIVRLREAVDGAAFQITILANRLEAHGDDVASPAQEFSSRLRAAIRAMIAAQREEGTW